ncbi:Ionotropic receptor 150 [Diabrotica virgifera virgifera]|nr:Ionotropic receptor 150 [Diabrotica virgifera virgifera]
MKNVLQVHLYMSMILHSSCNNSLLILETYESDDTARCVKNIVRSTVHPTDVIYLIDVDIKINSPAIQLNTHKPIKKVLHLEPTVYIISGNISAVVQKLSKNMILNNRAKFILILTKIDTESISVFNQNFFRKILIIIIGNMDVYTCSSDWCFSTGELCSEIKSTKHFFKKRSLNKITELDATWRPFEPYLISPTEGLHTELINMITSHLHLNVNYIETQDRVNPMAVESEFKENRYDFSFMPYLDDTTQFDKTITFTEDKSVYIVPRIIVNNEWQIFYREFHNNVWICFGVLILSLYMVIKLIFLVVPSPNNASVLEIIIGILLGGGGQVNTRSVSLKLLLTLYIFFSLLFSTTYRSKMFDIMKTDLSHELITSKDDVLKYNFKMGLAGESFVQLFKLSQNRIDASLTATGRVINCFSYTRCLDRVAFEKDIVSLRLLKPVKFLIPTFYLDSDGRTLIYILQERYAVPYYFGILFLKGHPLFEEFNKKILLLKEAGFVNYLYTKHERNYTKAKSLAQYKDLIKYSDLNLKTLQSTFMIYLICLAISLVIFCIELFLQDIINHIHSNAVF